MQGLETYADVDVQQTCNEDFGRQIFCLLNMYASWPVYSIVFMQKCASRNCLDGSGLTEVVRLNGRTYTMKHGKMLVEAITAGIESLEFRRKMERGM